MAWNSNLRKGTDIPTWDWMSFYPVGPSYHGTAHAYDGTRYMYWLIQSGSTNTASTTQLYRYDTWTDGWQYLVTNNNSYLGADLKYDSVRNVLWITTGNGTEWRGFNLNTTAITVSNVTLQPYVMTTMTPVLPATAGSGAGLAFLNDESFTDPAITGTALTGGSSTTVVVAAASNIFHQGMAGMRLRMTSGTYNGQYRTISSVNAAGTTATVTAAFGGTPAAGDTFIVEYAQGTATGTQSASTLQDTNQTWTTNFYANMDVKILSGTGAGQRRRIASNTSNTLTLASTVTGNARTGNWSVTPDATSVYEIVPSSDFLYLMTGSNGTGMYRIDLATGANAATWTTLTAVPGAVQGGGDLLYMKNRSPYVIYAIRGNGTSNFYQYNIGLNTWTSMPTTYFASETFNTGASVSSIDSAGYIFLQKDNTNRIYTIRLSDFFIEPAGTTPYAASVTYDGHRICKISTVDGVDWLYVLRAGGQEFYRLAIEWL